MLINSKIKKIIKISIKISCKAKSINVPYLRKRIWNKQFTNSFKSMYIEIQKLATSKIKRSTKTFTVASIVTKKLRIQFKISKLMVK